MEIAKIAVKETTGVVVLRKRIPAGIVGATVSVLFDSPVWGPLQKVVTFRVGDETLNAEFDGSNAVIPHECTKEPGKVLFFGIWGHDPETGLQLPLIEVRIGQIENATDPNATPATDPTLPIWAQLQAEIYQLKQSGVSEEKIAQVVNDYLAKNPPSVTEADKIEIAEMAAALVEIPDSGGNVDFKTDETLTLKNGILSVNTTDLMEQDNTLPITSAGVFATVGNIEALLKTI